MHCCLWDAALGSLPIWLAGGEKGLDTDLPRVASEGRMPGGGITCTHLHRPSSLVSVRRGLGRPGPPSTCSHLHPLFPRSALFFLKTTCGSKLVLQGRALPLVSFWLEIYFSVRVLCSCTWQSGVCSAVHSLANLAS